MEEWGDLTIPAGTLEASPASLVVPLEYGTVSRVQVYIPQGNLGYAMSRAFYQSRQVLPRSPGSYFRGNGTLFVLHPSLAMYEPPYEIELNGWSPDADYEHVIYYYFEITPGEAYRPRVWATIEIPEFLR